MEFKEKLKELRIKNKLTQESLGEMLHVSRSLIAKWESGLGIPTEDSIDKICEIFKMTKEQLIFDKNVEKIFVKKNIEINKVKKYLIVLGILLLFLVSFTLIYFINDYNQKKNIEKMKEQLTPIVTEISFNYYGPMSNYSQTKYLHDNKYILLQRDNIYLFVTIEIDERIYGDGFYFYDIEIPGVGTLDHNYISLVDELVKAGSNPKVFKNIYAIQLNEFVDVKIDKLYIKSMKYGKIYSEDDKSNVKYELRCDSDIIKIEYGTFMFLKPGRTEIEVDYNLGFYKGKTSFIVEAKNEKFANVYIGANKVEHIYYDEGKKDICFSAKQLDEIKKYYEEECNIFYENTGIKRTYIGLKQIDYNYYIPIFENDKKYNYQDSEKYISGDYILLDEYYNLNELPTEIRMNISDSLMFELNFDSLIERIIQDDHYLYRPKGKVYKKMIVEDNNIIDLISNDYNYGTVKNYGQTILKIYFEIHLNDGAIYYDYREIKVFIE